MNHSTLITIAGSIGSGKSSAAKEVAKRLGYTHFSSGHLFRTIAAEEGISIEEMNLSGEETTRIDEMVDHLLREMHGRERTVIDSRLAFHWLADSFKIFLSVDAATAAARISQHIQTEGRLGQKHEPLDDLQKKTELRAQSERKRYLALYNVDIHDTSPFDLVIDTKGNDLETVVTTILAAYIQADEH